MIVQSSPTIDMKNVISDYICSWLLGKSYKYLSCDLIYKASTDIGSQNELYGTEFLNSIGGSGIPPHKLTLKVGEPIMLLRNIDQSLGL